MQESIKGDEGAMTLYRVNHDAWLAKHIREEKEKVEKRRQLKGERGGHNTRTDIWQYGIDRENSGSTSKGGSLFTNKLSDMNVATRWQKALAADIFNEEDDGSDPNMAMSSCSLNHNNNSADNVVTSDSDNQNPIGLSSELTHVSACERLIYELRSPKTGPDLTLRQIAQKIGVPLAEVSQMYSNAQARLDPSGFLKNQVYKETAAKRKQDKLERKMEMRDKLETGRHTINSGMHAIFSSDMGGLGNSLQDIEFLEKSMRRRGDRGQKNDANLNQGSYDFNDISCSRRTSRLSYNSERSY